MKKQLERAEQKIVLLEKALENQRHKSKIKIKGGKIKPQTHRYRVIIPDSHGAHIDIPSANVLFSDMEKMKLTPNDEIVMLGDHLECGGFLAQHQALGYVAETEETFKDDVSMCNWFLDEIQSRSGGATIHYIEGNHEARIEKHCITMALRNTKDAQFLLDVLGPEAQLRLNERGIKYYKRSQFYHGIRIPGTIKLGKCYFTHGNSTAINAGKAHADQFGGNIVFGHVHRMLLWWRRDVKGDYMSASPGTLSKTQRLWNHTNLTQWRNGYGLQWVFPDGNFSHENAEIRNGMSYVTNKIIR